MEVSCPPVPSHACVLGREPSVSGSLPGAGFLVPSLQQPRVALAAGLGHPWTPGLDWVVVVAEEGLLDPFQVSQGADEEEGLQLVWGCMEANYQDAAAAAGAAGDLVAAAEAEVPSAAEENSSSPLHLLTETGGDGVEGGCHHLAVAHLEFPYHPSQPPAAEKVQTCYPG